MNILTILAVALGTIALFAVVFQILYLIKYRGMHYNWITFRRKGYALGLEKKEIKMLRDIAFDNRLADFDTIYTTIRLLDRSIIKSVHILKEKELSEAYKHKRIENIFLLRNKMDYIFAAQKKTISATNELKINQKIALTFERIGTYISRIVDNYSDHFAAEVPPEVTAVKDFSWKNKKVQVTFRISNDAEYSTISRVIDKVPHGNTPCLNIAHNNRLTRVQKRIYRRDNVDISVHIFALRIDVKKGKRKLVLANPKPFNGKITNISAGGLAIKAGGILKENSLVKLDFSMDLTNTDAAVGRVMTYSSIPNTNDKMLHIKFEKLSIKTRNRIFEYIYQGKKVDKKVFGPKTIIPPKSGLTITSVDENNN